MFVVLTKCNDNVFLVFDNEDKTLEYVTTYALTSVRDLGYTIRLNLNYEDIPAKLFNGYEGFYTLQSKEIDSESFVAAKQVGFLCGYRGTETAITALTAIRGEEKALVLNIGGSLYCIYKFDELTFGLCSNTTLKGIVAMRSDEHDTATFYVKLSTGEEIRLGFFIDDKKVMLRVI